MSPPTSEQDSDTASSVSVASEPSPVFHKFTKLPPEIRHHIFSAAIPKPGINFFNLHTFPNDHPGANRSTSPPSLYLDMRRMAIEDDDEDVAEYDPSCWQARHALRQTCREARSVCAIPEEKRIPLTLTVPKRGLFVRAGDGLLRSMMPLEAPRRGRDGSEPTVAELPETERVVHRVVEVSADELFVLSVENCSFNLPFEESPALRGEDDDDDADEDNDMGWSFDPEFRPCGVGRRGSRFLGIPASKFCIGLARPPNDSTVQALQEAYMAIWCAVTGWDPVVPMLQSPEAARLLTDDSFPAMEANVAVFDEIFQAQESSLAVFEDTCDFVGRRPSPTTHKRLNPVRVAYRDRWDDRYTEVATHDDDFFPIESIMSPTLTARTLVKLGPEKSDVRERYMRSAILQSPKRPK
ncbi:hypothetical protein PG993_003620 [Apiospora rasikravindrae]|uniref:2EXR domain-containing protein n=1 Tax=Apiospora rasikravindrae TaxID=990691 RepID=A0ABR1U2D6_9PEZI